MNRLNAAVLEDVLTMFEKGYRFVSLAEAETDQAFATPETYVSKWGPMWGYPAAALRSAAAPSPATLGRVDSRALELSKQPLSVLRSPPT
jgi:predicted transcriptional regulator